MFSFGVKIFKAASFRMQHRTQVNEESKIVTKDWVNSPFPKFQFWLNLQENIMIIGTYSFNIWFLATWVKTIHNWAPNFLA